MLGRSRPEGKERGGRADSLAGEKEIWRAGRRGGRAIFGEKEKDGMGWKQDVWGSKRMRRRCREIFRRGNGNLPMIVASEKETYQMM